MDRNVKELLLYNANIYTPDRILSNGWIHVLKDGTIGGLGGPDTIPEPAPHAVKKDAGGSLLLPGLIDVHVHGGGGYDAMLGTFEHLDGMSRYHAANGTTCFLATTMSAGEEELLRAVEGAAATMERGVGGAELAGLHLEGPYLNPARGGAQNPELLRPVSLDELRRCVSASGGQVRIVTLASELEGAAVAISWLAERGIVVSLGHTDANYGQAREAVRLGARHVTHYYNGMRPFHHRDPGMAGAGLLLPELTVELIADGIHVHPDIIRLTFQVKTEQAVCLITDAIPFAGCPDGDYELEGMPIRMENGKVFLRDGSSLAGSTLTMLQALRNAMAFTGLPLEQVLPAATAVPARQAGLSGCKGTLETGKDADFILCDDSLELLATYVRGTDVFRAGIAQQ